MTPEQVPNEQCPRCGKIAVKEGWTCATDVWMVTLECEACKWQTPLCLSSDAAVEYLHMYIRSKG